MVNAAVIWVAALFPHQSRTIRAQRWKYFGVSNNNNHLAEKNKKLLSAYTRAIFDCVVRKRTIF